MELMKGTLASIIAAGPSDPDLVRSVLRQTLDALAFLHEKQKVHGTVRPTNLLINDAGRVKLSEFEQTSAGGELRVPKGSKKYLAPELIKPEFGEFGPPLDLYCLGFTALELLKGPQFESLFPGTGKGAIDADLAWLRWHSSPDELPPAKKLVKNLPDDLAQVLDRMLKKRVADRPQSAQEVLSALADKPLIAVPVEGVEEAAADSGPRHHGPTTVRTLAAPQPLSPRGPSPAVLMGDAPQPQYAVPGKSATRSGKSTSASSKPAPPRFSKDWFNQQLGRPYILYPLCALMIAGFAWLSFGNPFGSKPSDQQAKAPAKAEPPAKTDVPAKTESPAKAEPPAPVEPPKPTLVAIEFDVQPDSKDLEVLMGTAPVAKTVDRRYEFPPGHHAFTFKKPGFEPLTREFDVSATNSKFTVKLEPVKKYVDVVIQVNPANAELTVGGKKQSPTNGSFTHKMEEGQPLKVEAALAKYTPVSRSLSAEDLKKLGNKVTIELEREKPRLPDSLIAKPGFPIDSETQLPTHVLATRLGDSEPLELVLVKPGNYKFGAPSDKRRNAELNQRAVRIEQPYYLAVYETTNAQYEKFFQAAGEAKAGTRWQTASRKWAGPQKVDPIKNHLPVTNVSVEEAQAFCTWIGGQLPTEIEWECAARGPDDKGFPQPWGDAEPGRDRCRIFTGEHLERGEGGPVPVEQLAAGASRLGLMHMIGNAGEWCQDSDRRGGFVLRGCSIATANVNVVRITWRAHGPTNGEESTGFRVAFAVNESSLKSADKAVAITQPLTRPKDSSQDAAPSIISTVPWGKIINAFTAPPSTEKK